MSKKKKIIIFILSIVSTILLIGVIFTIVLITNLNKPKAELEVEEIDKESDSKIIDSNTLSPSNYDAKEVMSYVIYRMSNINFEVTTKGESKAVIVTQKINNHRVVIDDNALITTVSTSSMKKVAKEKFFIGDERVLLTDADSINIDDATASFSETEVEDITGKDYINRYGWMPYQLTGYIISSDTYIKEPEMTINSDNTYLISMDLNPDGDYAPYFYRHEILTNSSSQIIPEFLSIHIEYLIDDDYRVLSANYKEKYYVKVGFKVPTETNCIDTFNYDNLAFDSSRYDFYMNYLNNN